MHRYQPRFHIVYLPQNGIKEECEYLNFRAFVFPETSFTAVTAYQNQRVSMTRVEDLLFAIPKKFTREILRSRFLYVQMAIKNM